MHEQPIDPEVMDLLTELMSSPSPSVRISELTAAQMRQASHDAFAIFTRDAAPIPIFDVRDDVVPGRFASIPLRIYSPEFPTAVIVFLHGGSWITGGPDSHDLVTRRLSRDTGATVVSVDYRMLPEHPFPAPLDDAYDAIGWAAARWPDLPLIVLGDSAGGTLAACSALRSRNEGGPRIDAQVLIYPAIDDDYEKASVIAFDGPLMTKEDLSFLIDQYASTEAAAGSPYALPGRATSLDRLPPAVIAIPGHDMLRSSEEDYAERLRAAGVRVTVQLDPELVHGWIDFAPRVPAASRAFTRLTDTVRELIGELSSVAAPSA